LLIKLLIFFELMLCYLYKIPDNNMYGILKEFTMKEEKSSNISKSLCRHLPPLRKERREQGEEKGLVVAGSKVYLSFFLDFLIT